MNCLLKKICLLAVMCGSCWIVPQESVISADVVPLNPPRDGTVVSWEGGGWNAIVRDASYYYLKDAIAVPVGLNGVVAVEAGYYHCMALKSDGTVVVWGDNYYGQTNVPVGLNGVVAIAAGDWHCVALKSDGTVVAWGKNNYGQTNVPVGLSGVVAIDVAFSQHSMALKSDGTVVAWGYNDGFGQTNVPVGLNGVVAIAAGDYHSMALKSDGTVVAWGYNEYGQTNVPVGLNGVVAIGVGWYHSVALKGDGTVVAWGWNINGQTYVPVGLNGVVAIDVRGDENIALKSDGTTVTWGGFNYNIQTNLNSVVAIKAGYGIDLALKSDGTVVSWDPWFEIGPVGLNGVVVIESDYNYGLAIVGRPVKHPSKDGPAEICPPNGAVGASSAAQSSVDNNRRQHLHDAMDFTTRNNTSGCVGCGADGSDGSTAVPEFELARFHRYLDMDQRSSFGPGVFSQFDSSLQLSSASGVITRIEWFDPLERVPFRFTASGPAGTYTDPHHQAVQGIFLTTTAGVATNSLATAARATVKRWDGTRLEFEIINLGSSSNATRMARLTGRYNRRGSALVISYLHPVTATDAALSYDRNRLWHISQVTDGYGRTASFTYGHSDGQWVVTSVACPGGTTLTYAYNANNLVGLNQVTYPAGDVSSFSALYDDSSNTIKLTMSDAGSSGIHRRKTLYLTPSTATHVAGSVAVYVPNQVHAVKNGNDEISYLSWVESLNAPDAQGATFYTYIYEGGGPGITGTLMRYDTNDGLPVRTQRAVSWVFGQPTSTYTWEVVKSYETGANQRLESGTEPDGTRYNYQRDPASGAITGTTTLSPGGATYSQETTTYNAFNQPLIETDGLQRKTRYEYDTVGNRLTKTAGYDSSVASTWQWTYNARGQVLTSSDANLNQTDYVYEENPGNHYRRLITVIEPPDVTGGPRASRHITYDAVGRVATTTDAEGRTATYLYDQRNRLSRITYPDTSYEEWTYGSGVDANLLITHRDRNGNLDTMTYDAAGRMTGKTRSSPTGTIAQTSSWTHVWGKDLPLTETIDGETTTFGYDFQFRRISETRTPRAGVTLVSSRAYGSDQYVNYEQDPYGRRIYQVYNELGLAKRTVRELVPGALAVPTTSLAARNAYLNGLTRIVTPNPAYVITDQVFDVEGQLIGTTDERAIISLMDYDEQGRITTSIDAATDASTVPATITPYAARTEFGYDANGNRTMVVHPRSFTRNPTTGDFTQIAVPYVTASAYTGRNLLKSVTEADGTSDAATVNFTYTLTKQKATQSDPRNAAWLTNFTYYACCNRLYQVIDALGFATTYTYDANGNVLTVRDANNTGENRTYDARNRPLTITNTDNETTTITYDENLTDAVGLSGTYTSALNNLGLTAGADGHAVETSNHLGETALVIRDGVGRVVRRVDGNGNMTTANYDGVVGGLVATSVTDALTNSTTSYADGSGLVRQTIDAQNRTSTATFDASGNQLTAHDPNSVGWTATYDLRDRRLTTTDTHGDGTAYTYDLHNNVLTTRDALLKMQHNTYDYRDRKITSSDRLEPVAGITSFEYDEANNLVAITDADSSSSGVTDYSYDQRGKLETEVFPAGTDGKRTVRTYTYDNGGRLWQRAVTTTPAATPALNELTTYGYDMANRLTSRTYSDGQGNDSFSYDDAGRLQTAVSGRYGSTVTRSYTGNTPAEKAGRLTSEQLTLAGANAGSWTVAYQYDAANRLSALTYPTSDTSVRTYTSRHQLDTVTFAGATVATRAYDHGGRLTSTTFGNSQVETRTYRSDANGIDNQLATQVIPGVTDFAYTYDANKRITQETNGLFSAQTQQFNSYDNENRLTGWSRGTDTQSWTLSKVGDWTSTTINGVAQARTHSAVHEVTAIGSVPLDYDLKGNLTQNQDGAHYNWDSENRLTTATVADTTYGVTDTAAYRYDALGRRVQKTVYGMTTTFVHAGGQVIHEFDAKIQLPAASTDDDGTGAGTPPGGGILQGAGVTRFNHQPSLSPIPPGFFADKGKVFDVRSNGKSYGWLTSARTDTVIRNQHPFAQFDTFNQAWLNNQGAAGTWEIALANGTYAVVVVMGDPASANQTNHLVIEGQTQTDPDPAVDPPVGYQRGDFDGYGVTATVADGRLTLSIPSNALNPKLCFIEIGPQGSSITQEDLDRLADAIDEATQATGLPPFPKPQPTPRQYVYGSYVDEPLLMRAAGERYYYATNRLYSVAAITSQAGQVVERYKYDAYGKQGILAENGVVAYKPSDYGQFKGFTGYHGDFETELYYARSRFYSPGTGRFLSRNPWQPNLMGIQPPAYFPNAIRGFGVGSYVQERYNLYDYAGGSPGDFVEPFSERGNGDQYEEMRDRERIMQQEAARRQYEAETQARIQDWRDPSLTYSEATDPNRTATAQYTYLNPRTFAPTTVMITPGTRDQMAKEIAIELAAAAAGGVPVSRVLGSLARLVRQGKVSACEAEAMKEAIERAANRGLGSDANFAQRTFGEAFSREGRFGGRTIDDVAAAIRHGEISPADVPIDVIVRDGVTLILNTRSAQALERAGIPRSQWSIVPRTGDDFFEGLLNGQLRRNNLQPDGIPVPQTTGPKVFLPAARD